MLVLVLVLLLMGGMTRGGREEARKTGMAWSWRSKVRISSAAGSEKRSSLSSSLEDAPPWWWGWG